jgi:hypothetical protein
MSYIPSLPRRVHEHYHGEHPAIQKKYLIDDQGGSLNAWRYYPENKPLFDQYCQSIEAFLERPETQANILSYIREIDVTKQIHGVVKLRKQCIAAESSEINFSSMSVVVGFSSASKRAQIALFVMTPFVIQKVPHQSVLKICIKLKLEHGRVAATDEKYLVKITDGHHDHRYFSSEYVDHFRMRLERNMPLAQQCWFWSILMKMRKKLRGATNYSGCYFSERLDVSNKGMFLKAYLFMPMLDAHDFDRNHAVDIPNDALWLPLVQCGMDLCILHELLAHVHGDVAHGFMDYIGSNIMLVRHDQTYDGILIDFEGTHKIGVAYSRHNPAYYYNAERYQRGVADPEHDAKAFLAAVEDVAKHRGMLGLTNIRLPIMRSPRLSPMRDIVRNIALRSTDEQLQSYVELFFSNLDTETSTLLSGKVGKDNCSIV